MKSFRNQPQAVPHGMQTEEQLLHKVCEKVGLSEAQKQHLLARVFFDPNALSYWVAMHQSDAAKAERYLVRMSPPRGPETAPMPAARVPRWLAPLARAVGLLS